MSSNGNHLPKSWASPKLKEVAQPTRPRESPKKFPALPFIGMENVEAHTMRLLGTVPASTMSSNAIHFYSGDVLYGRLRPYLNKVYRPEFEGLCSAEFITFPENEWLNSKYLQYFLNCSAFVSFASHLNAGDRPRVDFDQIGEYQFSLAPVAEQQRIVGEIEKQFTRLDAAVAALMRVHANLKRYRASVLKAACEGRLVPTEAELARREGRSYEPASELLKRILAASPALLNSKDLNELPEGWFWASLEQTVGVFVDSAHRTPRYGPSGFPALGPRDIVEGCVNLDNARLVDEAEFSIQTKRRVPQQGDIIYSRELSYGWAAMVPAGTRVCLSQGMCLFRPHESVSSRYLMMVLNGPLGRSQASTAATGSAHPHINLGDIKAYRIPLPPSAEQHRIIAELDRRLSIMDEIELQVEGDLKRAERLRQTILKCAFEGKLVPQDPNDEPAGVLLERIRAARARRDEGSNGNGARKLKSRKGQLTSV